MSDKVTQKTLAFKTFYRFFSGLREKSYLCGGGSVRRVRPVRVMRLGAGSGHGSADGPADGPGEAAGSGRSGEAPCFWNLKKNRKFGQRYEQTSEIGDSGPAGLFDGLLDGEGFAAPGREGVRERRGSGSGFRGTEDSAADRPHVRCAAAASRAVRSAAGRRECRSGGQRGRAQRSARIGCSGGIRRIR